MTFLQYPADLVRFGQVKCIFHSSTIFINSHSFFNFGASPKLAKRPSPRKKDSGGPKLTDPTLSKKMRESLALNQPAESDEDSSSSSEGGEGDYGSDSSEDGGGRPAPKKARRHSLPPPPQSMTGTFHALPRNIAVQ